MDIAGQNVIELCTTLAECAWALSVLTFALITVRGNR